MKWPRYKLNNRGCLTRLRHETQYYKKEKKNLSNQTVQNFFFIQIT